MRREDPELFARRRYRGRALLKRRVASAATLYMTCFA
jgi:hypothetical protein